METRVDLRLDEVCELTNATLLNQLLNWPPPIARKLQINPN